MFVRMSFGMVLVSWVMAIRPILNFRPSLAMVLYMLGPFSSRAWALRALGASSRTMATTGFSSSVPSALEQTYMLKTELAIMLPIRSSASSISLIVPITTVFPCPRAWMISSTVVSPSLSLKTLLLHWNPSSPSR